MTLGPTDFRLKKKKFSSQINSYLCLQPQGHSLVSFKLQVARYFFFQATNLITADPSHIYF